MLRWTTLLLACAVLAAAAGAAFSQSGMTQPPTTLYAFRGHYDPPPVAVARAGDELKMTFPASTIPYTISLKTQGDQILTSSTIQQHPDIFRWTSPTELTINLQGVPALQAGVPAGKLWVWGQLEDGNPLLQETGTF